MASSLLAVVSASLAVAALGARPTADDLHSMGYSYSFDSYKTDFTKVYGSDEEHTLRERNFNKALLKIQQHNSNSTSTWKAGVNQFSDMDSKEFASTMTGRAPGPAADGEIPWADCPSAKNFTKPEDQPKSLDWREHNAVTPVKNQGGCGSCWAFSTAETLESHVFLNTGKLLTLAPQEFVDCVQNPNQCGGTGGCEGATQWLGFEYAIKNGVSTETYYPYTARDGQCKAKLDPVADIKGYCRLPHVTSTYTAAEQYADLINAVNVIGPTAISVAAEPWQIYESGVFSSNCGSDIDHAVQLVGYGTNKGVLGTKDYWLVRNSWGESWGEKGYIRIERFGASTAGESCKTDTTPGDGTACKGDPSTLEVCGLCGIMSDSSYPVGGALVPPSASATF